MRVLYLTDRISLRGGADQHLLQVMRGAVSSGTRVTVAYGRRDEDASLPAGARGVRVKGLAKAVESRAGLSGLEALLGDADVVHVQNVMNPLALAMAVSSRRAVVTVQDHRVFCPGPGKTTPDGSACRQRMGDELCAVCLPDDAYRARALALTEARLEALFGARLLVLSRYMASELEVVGLSAVEVLPPWVEVSPPRREPGKGFVLGGRLVAHKGVVEGWMSWHEAATGHPLRVAGGGPLAASLAGAELRGWLAASELRALLRSARALIFPARWQEPFGILGVEALAEGSPVVVARAGGVSEWSAAGCLAVASGDVAAMASAIRRLASEPALAASLGEEGRRAVDDRFDRRRIESRLISLYAEVAGESGAPSCGTKRAARPHGGQREG